MEPLYNITQIINYVTIRMFLTYANVQEYLKQFLQISACNKVLGVLLMVW